MTTERTWALKFPPPAGFVTSNSRKDRRWDAERPEWRKRSAVAAEEAKLPKGLARARVDIVIAPEHRRRDDSAYDLTAKALVDGLGPPFVRPPSKRSPGANAPGYGLIPNDSRRHLDGPYVHVVDPAPPLGLVTVYITDLSDLPPDRTWTPRMQAGDWLRFRTKRACSGCGLQLGDVNDWEIEAAFTGAPLPDTTTECPTCRGRTL